MIIDWNQTLSPILLTDSFECSGTVTGSNKGEFLMAIEIGNEREIVTEILEAI